MTPDVPTVRGAAVLYVTAGLAWDLGFRVTASTMLCVATAVVFFWVIAAGMD